MTIYDITKPISPDLAVFPGDAPVTFTHTAALAKGDASNVSALTMSAHAGTHVDAPRHFDEDAPGIDALPLEVLIGPCQVITVNAQTEIALADVQTLDLSGVTRLLFHTRNSETPPEIFDPTSVYFSEEAAAWLSQRGLQLIGIDGPSVDCVTSDALPVHRAFLQRGIVIVENLCLSGVPDGKYELIALPLRLVNGDGSPARVVLRNDAE